MSFPRPSPVALSGLLESGLTHASIGRRYGVRPTTVSKWLRDAGLIAKDEAPDGSVPVRTRPCVRCFGGTISSEGLTAKVFGRKRICDECVARKGGARG